MASAFPLSASLSIFGSTGLTGYFTLEGLEMPKDASDKVLLINAAASATGSTCGQLAKLRGCKVGK